MARGRKIVFRLAAVALSICLGWTAAHAWSRAKAYGEWFIGTSSDRPTCDLAGKLLFETDTKDVRICDSGGNWQLYGPGDIKFGELLPDTAAGDFSTIAGDTTSLDSKIPSKGQATSANSLPVVLPSDQTVPTKTPTEMIVGSVTRPADTPGAYSIGDVLSDSTSSPTILTFANVCETAGGSAYALSAQVVTNQDGITSIPLKLIFFSVAPTAENDHAAYNPSDTERLTKIPGIMTFDTPVDCSVTGCSSEADDLVVFQCASESKAVYAIPVWTGAYTPASGEVFTVKFARFPGK